MYICLYQCFNTYRYIQIPPVLSACISESIHANKSVCTQIQAMHICLYHCSNTIEMHTDTTCFIGLYLWVNACEKNVSVLRYRQCISVFTWSRDTDSLIWQYWYSMYLYLLHVSVCICMYLYLLYVWQRQLNKPLVNKLQVNKRQVNKRQVCICMYLYVSVCMMTVLNVSVCSVCTACYCMYLYVSVCIDLVNTVSLVQIRIDTVSYWSIYTK